MNTFIDASTSTVETNKPSTRMSEGLFANAIEKQASRIPLDIILGVAVGAIATSAVLQMMGKKQLSNFIGHWVPTVLIIGLYNKVAHIADSGKMNHASEAHKTVN